MVAQCLANGLPMAGQWSANGWTMVGQWLAECWAMVDQGRASGWPMVDKWLAQMFGQGLANGWPMHDMDLFFPSKRLCLESRTMLAHNFQSFAHDFDARCIIRRCMCSNVMTHS